MGALATESHGVKETNRNITKEFRENSAQPAASRLLRSSSARLMQTRLEMRANAYGAGIIDEISK